jgi:hypothetical protein
MGKNNTLNKRRSHLIVGGDEDSFVDLSSPAVDDNDNDSDDDESLLMKFSDRNFAAL